MDLGLKNKIALVCGSSKGLGKATVRCLAEEGASIILCLSTPDNLKKAKQDIKEVSSAELTTVSANFCLPALTANPFTERSGYDECTGCCYSSSSADF
jgi:3-oxoacyl-[acyl-carrier protein] reductase